MMNSLPSSFDMAELIMDLPAQLAIAQNMAKNKKKVEIFETEEVEEEEANVALHRKNLGSNKKLFKGRVKKAKGVCFNYGKIDHFKSSCPKGKKSGQNRTLQRKAPNMIEFAGIVECNAATTYVEGWWIDSGVTRHIAKTKENLVDFKELKAGEQRIFMGNNIYLDVEGVGIYRLDLRDNIMVIHDVLYTPQIRRNLISVPVLRKKNLEVRFYNNRVTIGKNSRVLAMEKLVYARLVLSDGQDLF